jgi:hydroxyacylglutathione hydrolase
VTPFLDTDQRLGRCTALLGADAGKYPSGNSLLVAGTEGVVRIDPSTAVTARGGAPEAVDRILVSHAHEDHMAGIHLFPEARVHAHHDDLLGLHSIEGFMEVYGMPPDVEQEWRGVVVRDFHYTERPDATGLADGDVIDLGGGTTVTVVHLAGHTRGHCGFLVESEGVAFVGDVDLTGFGPYYGDHWSDLEDFERSIDRCRELDARWYVTFHQKGVVEGRERFLTMLDAFAAVIADRERRLLEFLAEPHTMDEIVAHRFVYRPGVAMLWVDHVERRSMQMHLDRLLPAGAVVEVEPGRYRAG